MKRALFLAAFFWGGCSGSSADRAGEGGGPDGNGSRGVVQGGPQDAALFRQIVSEGGIPDSELLDPVGFFAEHALDLPPADCGQDICVHPSLAVAPRFNGGNWTMAFVGMNTPVDPASLERPPAHVVLVVERTRGAESVWEPESIEGVYAAPPIEAGLRALTGALQDGDVVTLLTFGSSVDVLARAVPASDPTLVDALATVSVSDESAALYDALALAGIEAGSLPGYAGRVLLVTRGRAEQGITDADRVVALAESIAGRAVGVGVIGVGADYDPRLPTAIGGIGAGAYYYAQGGIDLARILEGEGETTLYPLATDFRLRIDAAAGYRIGRTYGARRAVVDETGVTLSSPVLFLGQREGSADVGGGRRGGGGGIFVELLAQADSGIAANEAAFHVQATWADRITTEPRLIDEDVANSLPPGENPRTMWVELSDETQGQAFMMLNMYLGLKNTCDFAEHGDCARAMGLVDLMTPTIEEWQAEYDNPDVQADFDLLMMLRDNVEAECEASQPVEPEDFYGGCMVS